MKSIETEKGARSTCEVAYATKRMEPAFQFLMLAVINVFQIEKFLRYFAFSGISSLNILAFFM